MTLGKAADIDSEDSVFRHLFSEKKKPRKITQAERMARIFAATPSKEADINVGDFLPSY